MTLGEASDHHLVCFSSQQGNLITMKIMLQGTGLPPGSVVSSCPAFPGVLICDDEGISFVKDAEFRAMIKAKCETRGKCTVEAIPA
jgi:hypothetical protein